VSTEAGNEKVSSGVMRSGLGRARGLGAAGDGVGHWWSMRVTSVALVPLTLWFVFSVAIMAGSDQAAVRAWIAEPLSAVLLLLLIGTTFHHLSQGLQTVIEDYVSAEPARTGLQLAQKFACVLLGALAAISVLRIAL
jgi:succinate dehydrogenase / fumarate reductase membrane anchor subunit